MLYSKCSIVSVLILNCLLINVNHGKTIDRCEFVHEMKRFRPQIDYHELNTWTCIAQYQSNFNTSLRNTDQTGISYHGIFQISDLYWCSNNPHEERACRIRCDQLHNAYLKDDFECLQQIYSEHLRIQGNGFNAWPIYHSYCNKGYDMIKDCLNDGKKSHSDYFSFTNKPATVKTKSVVTIDKKVHKIYERCELARELYYVHGLPFEQISKWVCIAKYESNFNTSAVGHLNADGSGDHGLFQISDIYWCSPPGRGWVCGLSCAKLENADISDDVQCMKRIYDEHQLISGDGFNAWTVYQRHCKYNVDHFISGCFEHDGINTITLPTHKPLPNRITHLQKIPIESKVYSRCELAQELRYRHNVPKEQIHTWVCIAHSLSQLNTSIESARTFDGTSSYGLFQINSAFWCSNDGTHSKGCQINCENLMNTDISDDIQCARKIFEDHQRLFGNGFHAWTPYENHCKYETPQAIRGCFDNDVDSKFDTSITTVKVKPSVHNKPKGKIYERCELARELRFVHNVPLNEIPTWVCIAQYQSNLVTSIVKSSEHGIFQISDQYWCSLFGNGKSCGISCSNLEDSDIADDIQCARKIHADHMRIFGDGFTAWSAYEPYCKAQTQFTSDCFNDGSSHPIQTTPHQFTFPTATVTSPNAIIPFATKKGKIYNRCELANELLIKYKIPKVQLHTWVCIAKHESNFDTSAIGRLNADGSGDHGIFQISDIYWCSIDGPRGKGCNAKCTHFEDSDISDDVACVKSIFNEHQRLYGNGFHAWTVYEPYCKQQTISYISDCFPNDIDFHTNAIAPVKPTISFVPHKVDRGRAYERCELAKELRYRHNVPKEQIADWVCIAIFQSNLATSARGVRESGLFQISHEYWCSNDGTRGKGCNIECSQLEDSDITDDVQCARHIYNAHQHTGNGFSAWNVYEPYCSAGKSAQYISGCFNDIPTHVGHTVHDVISGFVNRFNTPQQPVTHRTRPVTKGKIYDRCELAKELRYKHNMRLDHIHTWICIVQRESNFDTSAVGRLNADGSGDHGLFQISDIFWCSLDGRRGKGCNALCSEFEDTDISDDVSCVKSIYDEHQRIFGNGFHAWTTYEPYCKSTTSAYIDDCFAPSQNEIIPTQNNFGNSFTTFASYATNLSPITTVQNTISLPPSPPSTHLYSQTTQFSSSSPPFSKSTQPATASFQPIQTFIPTTPRSTFPPISQTTFSTSSSTKLNLFDFYLNQYSTKKPQKYVIPSFTSHTKEPITFANPYTVRRPTTTPIPNPHNTYHIPAALTASPSVLYSSSTSAKPSQYYQNFFQSQVAKFTNGANLTANNAPIQSYFFNPYTNTYQPTISTGYTTSSIATTPKPRVWRYSFSGLTKPSSL